MEIRIQETGQVVQEREFRDYAIAKAAAAGNQLALPDTLTVNMIVAHGGDPVLEAPAPTVGEFQSAQRNGVTRDALGNWVQAWTVIDWTPAQIDAAIAAAKAAKNAQINQWRLDANFTTFPYGGKIIACDQLSRSDIDAVNGRVATRGTFPAGFPNAWKTTDNTYIAIPDIATWNTFYDAMVNQGTANFNHSQQLKATLNNATTLTEINAIVW